MRRGPGEAIKIISSTLVPTCDVVAYIKYVNAEYVSLP